MLLESFGHSITQTTPQICERYHILKDVCSGTGSHLTEWAGFTSPNEFKVFILMFQIFKYISGLQKNKTDDCEKAKMKTSSKRKSGKDEARDRF